MQRMSTAQKKSGVRIFLIKKTNRYKQRNKSELPTKKGTQKSVSAPAEGDPIVVASSKGGEG